MLYSQQVLAVLVRDRHRAIAGELASADRTGLRRRAAAAAYALAKAVTVLAVVLDEEPVRRLGERAR
ncbi:MAG TPA: hypothetical protein VE826_01450 [Dongiaceae bacterium]|nr:hypothetical protein [Dongiaceae bacterium]